MPLQVTGEGYRDFSEPRFFEAETVAQVAKIRYPVDKSFVVVGEGDFLEIYKFDASSVATADGYSVIAALNPAVDGRWLRVPIGALQVDVRAFGAVGDGATVDTTAFQNALDYVRDAGGGKVYVPPGTYKIKNVSVWSNTTIFGAGPNVSILSQISGALATPHNEVLMINGYNGGSDANDIVEYASVLDLGFRGLSDTVGFLESNHLLTINGASRFIVDNCHFEGFQGDGIYIGSGNAGGAERHNTYGQVTRCYFDGINKENRNGISVIDCDSLAISQCYFTRCTKSTMPGAVDIEPDIGNLYHIVRGISVDNCWFVDIGGNVGAIAMVLWSDYTTKPRDFQFTNNTFRTTSVYAIGLRQDAYAPSRSTHDMGIVIANNYMLSASRGFGVFGTKGTRILNNTIISPSFQSLIGFDDTATHNNVDVLVQNNHIEDRAILVYSSLNLVIDGNTFINCDTNAIALQGTAQTSTYVAITNNLVSGAATTGAFSVGAGHTVTASTNTKYGNIFAASAAGDNFSGTFVSSKLEDTSSYVEINGYGRFKSQSILAGNPTTGKGIEMVYDPGTDRGILQCYDRDSGLRKKMFYDALEQGISVQGTEKLRVDASVTANDTALMLWDVTAGTLVRVSRGASDSGGVGFRLLRVPN